MDTSVKRTPSTTKLTPGPPSAPDTLATVTVAVSSLVIVPVAVSVAVTVSFPETARLTVKVSSSSTTSSAMVDTVKLCCSPASPAKLIAAVFAV